MYFIIHRSLVESDPEGEGPEERVPFLETGERVDCLPVEQFEVGRVTHVHTNCLADPVVEDFGHQFVYEAFLPAVGFYSFNHFVTGLPLLVHVDDGFRWMLQVGIHDDGTVSSSVS